MQRLHQYDLAGMLIEGGGWDVLKLAAIATDDETIPLRRGRVHRRLSGDVLHPARESLAVLDELKAAMGSHAFAAQYQQDPVPAGGNIIQLEWLRTWTPDMLSAKRGQIVQSWDTASKDGAHNDWSVCITAKVCGQDIYILDVFRARLEFPGLRIEAINQARFHRADLLLIEDHASGTQLIQTLRADRPRGVPSIIPRRAETDKVSRVHGVSAMIEAGQLHMPAEAGWLAEFTSELLAFPNARHDDQVDALSQLLDWVRQRSQFSRAIIAAPIVVQTKHIWP